MGEERQYFLLLRDRNRHFRQIRIINLILKFQVPESVSPGFGLFFTTLGTCGSVGKAGSSRLWYIVRCSIV